MSTTINMKGCRFCPECGGDGEFSLGQHSSRCEVCRGRGRVSLGDYKRYSTNEARRLKEIHEVEAVLDYVKERLWADDEFRARLLKEARVYAKLKKASEPKYCLEDNF